MEKVLTELLLTVNYRVKGKIHDIEVYGKNLPMNVIVGTSGRPNYANAIGIVVQDTLSFQLLHTDAQGTTRTTDHLFGEEINAPGGAFKVVWNENYPSKIPDPTPVFVRFLDAEDLATSYSDQLIVEPANKTGSLLDISLLDAIPDRGKDILQTLIEIYAEESVKYQNQLAISTIEIIDERLKLLTGEITDVEKDIATYKQENDLTNISSDAAVYLQSAQAANRQLEEYQTQIDVLNSLENYLRQSGDEVRLVPSSLSLQDPTLTALISEFNSQQLEKKSLLRTTPADNPLVVNIDRTLTDLKVDILENLKNIKNGLLIAQNNVRSNSSRVRAQIAKVPTAERALLSINRDQGIKQELYLYLLQKREEEALSLEAPITNTRIVDPPKAGNIPESPNKTAIYLGALIFGLFLPFTIVYVKDKINDKIQGIEDIERMTAAPLLGEIGHNEENRSLVVSANNSSPVAELFRLMRFNLNYLSSGHPNKVILVTSGLKGEGKTFFTINLAASLALTGKKVVALSFDLREPRLMQELRMPNKEGISDYLTGEKVNVKDITLISPDVDGLYLVGSGPVPPNVGELMLHEKVGTLIEELKQDFDYVIIDSAPVGKVADAFALAPYIDTTIFVLRQNVSGKEELRVIEDIYQNQKLKRPMLVLNDTHTADGYGYGDIRKLQGKRK